MTEDEAERQREIDELLARTRKNIAESEALMAAANLRFAETDRMLESQGLTREQVRGLTFSREQKLAVNEELRRLGLPPIEEDDAAYDFDAATEALRDESAGDAKPAGVDDVVAERSRKFGNFMQEYRI